MKVKILAPALAAVLSILVAGTLIPGEYEAAIQRWLGASNQIQPASHFVLFVMIGGLLSWLLRHRAPWLPLALCLVPALGTEWLQHFSSNRHPRLSDVGIDMLGASLGWLIVQLTRLSSSDS